MKMRCERWALVGLLAGLFGAVACGGDEAETAAPPASGGAGNAGASGATGGGAGKAGSAAGTAGANAGNGGTSAGTGGAGAGSGGTSAGSAGSTAGSGGATAGSGGGGTTGGTSAGGAAGSGGTSSGGTAGTNAGGSAGTNAGGAAGTNAGGSAGTNAGGAAGANAGGADAGGAAGANAGGAAGAAGADAGGAAGASGYAAYPFFNDPRNVIWVEADRFTINPPDQEFRVAKWLDLGNYAIQAEVGLVAASTAPYPGIVNVGIIPNEKKAIKVQGNGFSFQRYGSVINKIEKGYSLFFRVSTGGPNAFEPLFDCGTKEETADLSSLEYRVFFGRDTADGLQYSVFDGAGAMVGTVKADGVFATGAGFRTFGVTHGPDDVVTLFVESGSVAFGKIALPKATRSKCYFGRSLLRNRPDNKDLDANVQSIHGFNAAIDPIEVKSLQKYVTERWNP